MVGFFLVGFFFFFHVIDHYIPTPTWRPLASILVIIGGGIITSRMFHHCENKAPEFSQNPEEGFFPPSVSSIITLDQFKEL